MRDLITSLTRPSNKTPVPYVTRSDTSVSRLFDQPRGAEAQIRAYGSNGTLFGIVNRTSTATAAVGWRLWQKAASGKKEDRKEVTRHLALQLLNRPNKFFTQRLLFEASQQHVDLTGEGRWVVARNPSMRSIPLELWPVRPDRIRPVVSPTEFIIGYVYTGPSGEEIPLQVDEVLTAMMPDPDNPYRGLGYVQALMRTIDSQKYSEEWNRNFFINSAEPGGIIEVEKRLSDDEFDEMTARWSEQHRGVANAHRVAVIEQGKWIDRKYTMRDMQFAELSKVGDEKLFTAFGISKAMLGVTEDVNRANADAGMVMFARYLLVPRLDRFKDMLNFQFLPLFGETTTGLEFDYDDPVPPDAESIDRERTSKATAAKTYIDAGFTGPSVVEALELPESLVWEKPEPPAPPQPPAQPGEQRPPARKPAALRLLNAAEEGREDDPDLEQVQADWEEALAALLVVWAGISAAQQAELLPQIVAAVAVGDVAALAALTVSTVAAAAVLTTAMAGMGARAARRMAAEAAAQGVQVPVPVSLPGLDVFAEAVARLMGEGLSQAAGREALRVYAPGVPAEAVAQMVGEHLDGLSDAYLKEQLGAALTRAQNVGRLETVKDVPQTIYSSSEILDKATCVNCRKINGTVFDTWMDAWRAYAGGPYHACLGRNRCRGTVKATWNVRAGDGR